MIKRTKLDKTIKKGEGFWLVYFLLHKSLDWNDYFSIAYYVLFIKGIFIKITNLIQGIGIILFYKSIKLRH
jgi:Zn-dependent membrane protease YugP